MLASVDLAQCLNPVLMARAAGIEPDPWQQRLLRSHAKRIIMLCSRQVGKSLTVSLLACHVARYTSNAQIVVLAPTQRQSEELLRTIRGIWNALPDIGIKANADTLTRLECSNGSRILALPGSKGDGIRGLAAITLLVIDEASRCLPELLAAARPMLSVSDGRLVLLSTPAGQRGWFYEEWTNGVGYERFSVRASDCPRISPEFLESERRTLGIMFEQEYCCCFVGTSNSVFSSEMIERCVRNDLNAWNMQMPWHDSTAPTTAPIAPETIAPAPEKEEENSWGLLPMASTLTYPRQWDTSISLSAPTYKQA